MGVRISGYTKVAGLMGDPLGHSASFALYNFMTQKTNFDMIYVPLLVHKSDIRHAIMGVRAFNMLGCNVTMPHKHAIMKFLDSCSQESIDIGAVNVVKNVSGKLCGFNTDAAAFLMAFKEDTGADFDRKRVCILGAGGAARATANIVLEGHAEKLRIVNRDINKAAMQIVDAARPEIGVSASAHKFSDKIVNDIIEESDIIINTTPVGMLPYEYEFPRIDYDRLHPNQIIYDIIYNPCQTKFMKKAASRGCRVFGGLRMFFYQAINSYKIWTGIELEKTVLIEVYNRLRRENNHETA